MNMNSNTVSQKHGKHEAITNLNQRQVPIQRKRRQGTGPSPSPSPSPSPPTTELTASALVGAVTIEVADTTGFSVGDFIMISAGPSQDVSGISEIYSGSVTSSASSATITLISPLTFAYTVGTKIAMTTPTSELISPGVIGDTSIKVAWTTSGFSVEDSIIINLHTAEEELLNIGYIDVADMSVPGTVPSTVIHLITPLQFAHPSGTEFTLTVTIGDSAAALFALFRGGIYEVCGCTIPDQQPGCSSACINPSPAGELECIAQGHANCGAHCEDEMGIQDSDECLPDDEGYGVCDCNIPDTDGCASACVTPSPAAELECQALGHADCGAHCLSDMGIQDPDECLPDDEEDRYGVCSCDVPDTDGCASACVTPSPAAELECQALGHADCEEYCLDDMGIQDADECLPDEEQGPKGCDWADGVQQGCVWVNHVNDSPGEVTCDYVSQDENCRTDLDPFGDPLCPDERNCDPNYNTRQAKGSRYSEEEEEEENVVGEGSDVSDEAGQCPSGVGNPIIVAPDSPAAFQCSGGGTLGAIGDCCSPEISTELRDARPDDELLYLPWVESRQLCIDEGWVHWLVDDSNPNQIETDGISEVQDECNAITDRTGAQRICEQLDGCTGFVAYDPNTFTPLSIPGDPRRARRQNGDDDYVSCLQFCTEHGNDGFDDCASEMETFIYVGSGQQLSCAHACHIRSTGIAENECKTYCGRHVESGCDFQAGENAFNLCVESGCDTEHECITPDDHEGLAYCINKRDGCIAGCEMYNAASDGMNNGMVDQQGTGNDDQDNDCEKNGDAGDWQCPQSDQAIPCAWVCDSTVDCPDEADEDLEFCAAWTSGGGQSNSNDAHKFTVEGMFLFLFESSYTTCNAADDVIFAEVCYVVDCCFANPAVYVSAAEASYIHWRRQQRRWRRRTSGIRCGRRCR